MIASIRSSGLLRYVAARVLPAAVLVLAMIWVSVSYVSEKVFQAEIDAKLTQQAESQAIVAKTRLQNLVTTVRDLASNDLLVNGLIDSDAETNYLKAFMRSVAIESFSDFPIVLTDYRGRPIVGRALSTWDQAQLREWNDQVSQEMSLVTQKDAELVIAVPVYIGHLVEGMLAIRFSPEQLHQIISPIDNSGWVALVSVDEKAPKSAEVQISEGDEAHAFVELILPESDQLKLLSAIRATAMNSASSYFQWFMLVAFILDLVALVCGILAAVYLVIKPLKRFIAHLQRAQQEGELLLFEASRGPSEVQQLADSFNRFVQSEKDLLEERKAHAEQLTAALEREKELNGLQRQFVSMVCHEFRTPLAIIDGNAYRVFRRHRTMAPDRLEEALGKIRVSVTRLTDLMESVLSAARLEAGTIKFEPDVCDPAKLVQEVVANHQEVNPRYRLIADLEQLPSQFKMDMKLMRQVISNLISNAIKYSAEDTQIWIHGSSNDDKGLSISVRDEGVGIPEDELNRLFERFFRASTSTGIAGTGIGLHIVKALVDLHQGQVQVKSEVEKGTTFTIYLPYPSEQMTEPVLDDVAAA